MPERRWITTAFCSPKWKRKIKNPPRKAARGGGGLPPWQAGARFFILREGEVRRLGRHAPEFSPAGRGGLSAWQAGARFFALREGGVRRLGGHVAELSPAGRRGLAAFRRRKTAGKTRPSSWGRRMTKRALGPFWKTRGTRCASRDTNCFECAKSTSSADLVRYAGKSSPVRCVILTREPGFPYLPGETGGFHEKIP